MCSRAVCRSMSLSASMKPTPSCSPSALAERLAPARVLGGDVVRAPGLAEPAHAVREARRREPHLRVAEALADLAEHVGGGNAHVLELDHPVAAGEAAVERVHGTHDADALAVHVGEEHRRRAVLHARHDDRVGGALGAGDEPLRAVDDVVVAVAHGARLQHRRVGAGAGRRLGHREARARAAATCGTSQRSFCAGVATSSIRWMLPSSGAWMLSAVGPRCE